MCQKRILWVENQLDYAAPHLDVLRRAGYKVDTARSADEALEKLGKSDIAYDMILLDVLMGERPVAGHPVKNGLTGIALLAVIRDDLGLTIPLVFVTVMVDPNVVAELGRRESARGQHLKILHKPVRPSEVLEIVTSAIGPARQVGEQR